VLIRTFHDDATVAGPVSVWVREDRIPTSATTPLFGKPAVLAPPEPILHCAPPPKRPRALDAYRAFFSAHAAHGPLLFDADEPTETGYEVWAVCVCGAEWSR